MHILKGLGEGGRWRDEVRIGRRGPCCVKNVTDGKDKAGAPRGSEVMTLGGNEVRDRRRSLAAAWGGGDLRWTGYAHPGCFFARAADKGLTLDAASRYPPAGATLDVFSVIRESAAGLAEGFLNTEGAEHTERRRGKEGKRAGLASRSYMRITWKWITVKVQYWVLSFRNETREVEWIEVVGGNLGVW